MTWANDDPKYDHIAQECAAIARRSQRSTRLAAQVARRSQRERVWTAVIIGKTPGAGRCYHCDSSASWRLREGQRYTFYCEVHARLERLKEAERDAQAAEWLQAALADLTETELVELLRERTQAMLGAVTRDLERVKGKLADRQGGRP